MHGTAGRRRGKLPGTSQAPGPHGSGTSGATADWRRDRWGGIRVGPCQEPHVSRSIVAVSSRAGDLPDFVSRHIGPSESDVAVMLETIGQSSLESLADTAVPGAIRAERALHLDAAPSETAVIEELRSLARRNHVLRSMIGLGYYGTVTPAVIQRNVLENPAWYTAYTPYQPEISQGRLEALLNFQTVVSDLTGLPTAGASLLDEGTAAAEAMTLMRRSSKAPADAVLLVDSQVFPQTLRSCTPVPCPSGSAWRWRT